MLLVHFCAAGALAHCTPPTCCTFTLPNKPAGYKGNCRTPSTNNICGKGLQSKASNATLKPSCNRN